MAATWRKDVVYMISGKFPVPQEAGGGPPSYGDQQSF